MVIPDVLLIFCHQCVNATVIGWMQKRGEHLYDGIIADVRDIYSWR